MSTQFLFSDDKGTCMDSANTNKLNFEICIFALSKVNVYLQLYIYIYIYIYVSEVARGELTDVRISTKEIKELIEGLTENVINTDKVNMERFKQMKEFFLQLMKDSYANLEVQAYGESYSICFCYTLYTQMNYAETQVVRKTIL